MIYDGAQEEHVKTLLKRALAEAKRIPGIKIGISDAGRIYG